MDWFVSLILALAVFLAAILPTLAPGGALRDTVELCQHVDVFHHHEDVRMLLVLHLLLLVIFDLLT